MWVDVPKSTSKNPKTIDFQVGKPLKNHQKTMVFEVLTFWPHQVYGITVIVILTPWTISDRFLTVFEGFWTFEQKTRFLDPPKWGVIFRRFWENPVKCHIQHGFWTTFGRPPDKNLRPHFWPQKTLKNTVFDVKKQWFLIKNRCFWGQNWGPEWVFRGFWGPRSDLRSRTGR